MKTFQGPHLPELMRQIKEECGPDAIIMDKRRLGHGYEVMVKRPPVVATGAAVDAGLVPAGSGENARLTARQRAFLPVDAAAEPALRAGQLLTRRLDALHAPLFGPQQLGAVQTGRKVIDVMSDGRMLPPSLTTVLPATRPLTYGATAMTRPAPGVAAATGAAAPGMAVDGPATGIPAAASVSVSVGATDTWQAIRALQGKMEEIIRRQHGPAQSLMAQMLVHLQEQDIAPEVAQKLCADFSGTQVPGQSDDYHAVCERLTNVLVRAIDFGSTVEPLAAPACVLVLMGPTGVGKTTTAVKLAARFAITARRKVALLTIDATRPGGGEALRRYAEVLHVPCEVAGTAAEAADAWSRVRDHEVVIIDTAGCSPRDQRRLDDLRVWLDALEGERQTRLLVMSATAKGRDLRRIAETFGPLRYDRFVFTKLDETTSVGNLFALLQSTRVPALYVTNGQEVTGDLELLCPVKLARGISRTLPRF